MGYVNQFKDFKQSTFMVIDGSTSKSELSEQLKIVILQNLIPMAYQSKLFYITVVAMKG